MTMESPATAATELAARPSPNRVRTLGASSEHLTAIPVRDHCLAPERVEGPVGEAGRYGRMFDLPALEVDEALLHRIAAVGGSSDAGDSHGRAGAARRVCMVPARS
jgi:hypothetical protein